MRREVHYGLGKGAVYPAAKAKALLNPLRRLVQPPGRIVGRLGLAPDSRVLEIGPGPGYFSIEAAAQVPEGLLCMFDLQEGMLKLAQERVTRAGLTNCRMARGDAMELPFKGDAFDVAFLVAVLGEIPGPGVCLTEVFRVLRPGGLLSVTEMRGDPDRVKPDNLRELAAGCGFLFEAKNGGGWSHTFSFRKPVPAPR